MGGTEEKFISTEGLRVFLIISFKSLSALDFKVILNIIEYIPVISGNSNIYLLHRVFEKANVKSCIRRAKEPSKKLKYCV